MEYNDPDPYLDPHARFTYDFDAVMSMYSTNFAFKCFDLFANHGYTSSNVEDLGLIGAGLKAANNAFSGVIAVVNSNHVIGFTGLSLKEMDNGLIINNRIADLLKAGISLARNDIATSLIISISTQRNELPPPSGVHIWSRLAHLAQVYNLIYVENPLSSSLLSKYVDGINNAFEILSEMDPRRYTRPKIVEFKSVLEYFAKPKI
jgi:hypothetical protein